MAVSLDFDLKSQGGSCLFRMRLKKDRPDCCRTALTLYSTPVRDGGEGGGVAQCSRQASRQTSRLRDRWLKNRETARLEDRQTGRFEARQSDLKADHETQRQTVRLSDRQMPNSKTDRHVDGYLRLGRSEQFPAEVLWSRSRHELGRLLRLTPNPQQRQKRLP